MSDEQQTEPQLVDLGLSYKDAMHGMQTAVAYELSRSIGGYADAKDLRVGINSAHITDFALVKLLVDKGVFTWEEFDEALRLAANNEVARYEALHTGITFR